MNVKLVVWELLFWVILLLYIQFSGLLETNVNVKFIIKNFTYFNVVSSCHYPTWQLTRLELCNARFIDYFLRENPLFLFLYLQVFTYLHIYDEDAWKLMRVRVLASLLSFFGTKISLFPIYIPISKFNEYFWFVSDQLPYFLFFIIILHPNHIVTFSFLVIIFVKKKH